MEQNFKKFKKNPVEKNREKGTLLLCVYATAFLFFFFNLNLCEPHFLHWGGFPEEDLFVALQRWHTNTLLNLLAIDSLKSGIVAHHFSRL